MLIVDLLLIGALLAYSHYRRNKDRAHREEFSQELDGIKTMMQEMQKEFQILQKQIEALTKELQQQRQEFQKFQQELKNILQEFKQEVAMLNRVPMMQNGYTKITPTPPEPTTPPRWDEPDPKENGGVEQEGQQNFDENPQVGGEPALSPDPTGNDPSGIKKGPDPFYVDGNGIQENPDPEKATATEEEKSREEWEKKMTTATNAKDKTQTQTKARPILLKMKSKGNSLRRS